MFLEEDPLFQFLLFIVVILVFIRVFFDFEEREVTVVILSMLVFLRDELCMCTGDGVL